MLLLASILACGQASSPTKDSPTDSDGYTLDDCNDANASIHPGASELCNGVDDNCNGTVDEDLMSTFYTDADGDGYGDPGSPSIRCTTDSGFVDNNTDCDDTNADIHPDAIEWCDTTDDNCDGLANRACRRWLGLYTSEDADAHVDGIGGEWVAIGDLDGDGAADLATGERSGDGNLGKTWVFGGITAGGEYTDVNAFATVTGDIPDGHFGEVGAIPGDVTGDGMDDLVLAGALTSGIMVGPLSGALTQGSAWTTFNWTFALNIWAFAGLDSDGDGSTDLVISAPNASDRYDNGGTVYLLSGPVAMGDVSPETEAIATISGSGTSWYFGESVSNASDVDGDGFDDLWVTTGDVALGWGGSVAFLFKGPLVGVYDAEADADTIIYANGGLLGGAMSGIGDLDGDGYSDLAFGGNWVFIVSGPPAAGQLSDGDATAILTTGGHGGIETGGDLDGDGRADLVIGAPSSNRYSEAYLYYGPVLGTLSASDADATFGDDGYYDAFGFGMAAGDLDNDGVDDVAISDPDSGAGFEMYLFLGGG